MVKLMKAVTNLVVAIGLIAFAISVVVFETAPAEHDAAHPDRVTMQYSLQGYTDARYMSAAARRAFEISSGTTILSLVLVVVSSTVLALLERRQKKREEGGE